MKRKDRTVRMNISIPTAVKDEMEEHPEINWSAVASNAFVRQLRAQKVLEQFAEAGIDEEEALQRGLQLQHQQKIVSTR